MSSVSLRPLYPPSSDTPVPYCFLLSVDEYLLLIDCGCTETFDLNTLTAAISPYINSLDAVLLSHSSLFHLGALPHLITNLHLSCDVYATLPTWRMGQLIVYDAIQNLHISPPTSSSSSSSSSLLSINIPFTFPDIDFSFDKIKQLKYNQEVRLSSSKASASSDFLTVIPIPSAHSIGGTIWRIVTNNNESLVYSIDFNHSRERHLNGSPIENDIVRPLLLITDAATCHQSTPPIPRKQRDQKMMESVQSAVMRGGSIIFPSDTAGRVLELLLILNSYWEHLKSHSDHQIRSLSLPYSLIFLSHQSSSTLDFARAQIEWMSDACQKQFDSQRENPFQLRLVKCVSSLSQLKMIPKPHCIVGTSHTLSTSMLQEILPYYSNDAKNLILFTQASPVNSLSYRILNAPKGGMITYNTLVGRELEGDELAEWRRKEKKKENKLMMESKDHVEEDGEGEDNENENDDNDNNNEEKEGGLNRNLSEFDIDIDMMGLQRNVSTGSQDHMMAVENENDDDHHHDKNTKVKEEKITISSSIAQSLAMSPSLRSSSTSTSSHSPPSMKLESSSTSLTVPPSSPSLTSRKRSSSIAGLETSPMERSQSSSSTGSSSSSSLLDPNVLSLSHFLDIHHPHPFMSIKKGCYVHSYKEEKRVIGPYGDVQGLEEVLKVIKMKKQGEGGVANGIGNDQEHNAFGNKNFHMMDFQSPVPMIPSPNPTASSPSHSSSSPSSSAPFPSPSPSTLTPYKLIPQTRTIDISCEVLFIDLCGLSDFRSLKTILTRISPRSVMIIGGLQEGKDNLRDFVHGNVCKDVVVPTDWNVSYSIQLGRNSFRLRISDEILSHSKFIRIGEYEISHIANAMVKAPQGSSKGMQTALPVLAPNKKIDEESGLSSANGGKKDVAPLPVSGSSSSVFLGDFPFVDLRNLLLSNGIQSEFYGGVLVSANGMVQIKKVTKTALRISGVVSEEYFKVRQIIYSKFTIV